MQRAVLRNKPTRRGPPAGRRHVRRQRSVSELRGVWRDERGSEDMIKAGVDGSDMGERGVFDHAKVFGMDGAVVGRKRECGRWRLMSMLVASR